MYGSECIIGFIVLAFGRVANNSTLNLRPRTLFLATRPEARTLNPITQPT